jgi:S-adenosylmethionine:tRNA ribosyltransferase-isomerase
LLRSHSCRFRYFNPVEVEDLSKHKMDSEELKITQEACDIVNGAKEKTHS